MDKKARRARRANIIPEPTSEKEKKAKNIGKVARKAKVPELKNYLCGSVTFGEGCYSLHRKDFETYQIPVDEKMDHFRANSVDLKDIFSLESNLESNGGSKFLPSQVKNIGQWISDHEYSEDSEDDEDTIQRKRELNIQRVFGSDSIGRFEYNHNNNGETEIQSGMAYKCDKCDAFFLESDSLEQHLLLHEEKQLPIKCQECPAFFFDEIRFGHSYVCS